MDYIGLYSIFIYIYIYIYIYKYICKVLAIISEVSQHSPL